MNSLTLSVPRLNPIFPERPVAQVKVQNKNKEMEEDNTNINRR
jgi:hypothetical protein